MPLRYWMQGAAGRRVDGRPLVHAWSSNAGLDASVTALVLAARDVPTVLDRPTPARRRLAREPHRVECPSSEAGMVSCPRTAPVDARSCDRVRVDPDHDHLHRHFVGDMVDGADLRRTHLS